MKHEVKTTDNYLLVVDDSEIKEGDYYLSKISDDVFRRAIGGHWIENYDKKMYHKVIAHLPLNRAPQLEGVPLLPSLPSVEDDVEKMAKKEFPIYDDLKSWENSKEEVKRDYWKNGYNKAKEKYRFTEEDMRKAYMSGKHGGATETHYEFEELIQSLSQPKMPIVFECEWTPMNPYEYTDEDHIKVIPKTTSNSQGQTEWVGKWIY